jgi:hypothetical protein
LAQDTPRSSSIGRLEIVNLVVVVLIVAGVAGLNRVVDPFQRHADFDLGLHHREVTWRMSYPHFNLATWLRAPSEGVLLGDSRMLQIQPEALEEATGLSWTNMAAGGSSGRDIVENLRFVLTHTAPQHAVIGWNLNLLNGAHQTDHVASAREIIESPLRYHLNPFITKASAFLLYEKWTGENPISETPPMSPEQFWEHQLKVTAAFAYRDFQMPDALLADLLLVPAMIEVGLLSFPARGCACLGALGRIRDADSAFATALTLEPDNVHVLHHRGSFLQKAQRLTELLEILYRIDALAPSDGARDAGILHLTGIVVGRHLGRENPVEARACIERAALRFGNNPALESLRELVNAAP